MLASPPRPGGTAFRDLLVHNIPDRDDPTFATVLARRPNPGGAADPLRDDGADLDHLRVVSRHDIAGIWAAFFPRCQRYRC